MRAGEGELSMYDVILADPPWHFDVWDEDTGAGRSASAHYPTMSIEHICAIDVASLAAPNCALFLWCCWPSMNEYPWRVLSSWGFAYKTIAWEWVKLNKSSFGFHVGMGYYTRANTEPCILAVRGKMPVAARDVQALICSPVRDHSRKPDEQYAKIERLYPGAKYLEMFARRRRPGWDVFGNQVEGSISL